MKKIVLALAAIAMVGVFSSCKKNCDCTYKILGQEATVTYKLEDLQKGDSNIKKCSDVKENASINGTTYAGMSCK